MASIERGPVLVVEPNMDGHRFSYVSMLVAHCHSERIPVTVLTTSAGKNDFLDKTDLPSEPDWAFLTDRGRAGLREIETVSRRLQAVTVVVPDGDRIALRLACRPVWRGSGQLRMIVMRWHAQRGRYAALVPLKTHIRRAGFAVAETIPRVTLLRLTSALKAGELRPGQIADPIEYQPTEAARRSLGESVILNPERFWFCVAGWLDARKNIELVLAALSTVASRTGCAVGLLLAGRQDPVITDQLTSVRPGNVEVTAINRHLTAAELDVAVESADCVILAHSNEGPSGILGKAAAAGTTVIAAGAKTLAADCRRLGPPAQWVELDKEALARAAEVVMSQPSATPIRVASPADFAAALLDRR